MKTYVYIIYFQFNFFPNRFNTKDLPQVLKQLAVVKFLVRLDYLYAKNL